MDYDEENPVYRSLATDTGKTNRREGSVTMARGPAFGKALERCEGIWIGLYLAEVIEPEQRDLRSDARLDSSERTCHGARGGNSLPDYEM